MNYKTDDFEVYHIDREGKRVDYMTCVCNGCFLERVMREQLQMIDALYAPRAKELRDPRDIVRLARAWENDRSRIVSGFSKVWIGCLMPMVLVLTPKCEPGADVEPQPLRSEDPPADLHDRD